ncbi:MAG: nucleoid occlusion factor SlmA, partial [Bryobacteraceae bacterium]
MHLYGHPADMDAIRQVVAVHGLWVIEDAAEAHTARYKGRPVRSLGRAAAFSFYGNKIFSCGEGGAVTVDDEHLEIRMRMLRGQGMDPARRYWFPVIGYNYRLSNLACALLCAQLERREQILQALAAMLEKPGAERITTAALAAHLGVSEAALYRHFASKAQMFEGLIEFIEQSVFTLVQQIVGRD